MASTPRLKVGVGAGVIVLAAALASKWEGKVYPVYRDPVGVLTVCYGHTGPELRLGQTYNAEQCDALLRADLAMARAAVNRCLPMPKLVQIEAALTDAVFNLGPSIVCKDTSTVRRKALANDWPGACAALDLYNKAGGRVFNGLVYRRADERALCERGTG
jgi:lysozyme